MQTYRITRPAGRFGLDDEPIELRVHTGPRLRFPKAGHAVEAALDDVQHASVVLDGWEVKALALPKWTLSTAPADYIAQHESDADPSERVRGNLELARLHVAEQDRARPEPGGEG